jgi:hypothetical protein
LAATLLFPPPAFAGGDEGCADEKYLKAHPERCAGSELPPIEKPTGPDNKSAEIRKKQQETIAKNKAKLRCKSRFPAGSKKRKECLATVDSEL